MIQIFSTSQKIKIPKYITVSYSETETKNKAFCLLLLKTISICIIMVYENSFNAAAYTLKVQAINPSCLKKLSECENLYKT